MAYYISSDKIIPVQNYEKEKEKYIAPLETFVYTQFTDKKNQDKTNKHWCV